MLRQDPDHNYLISETTSLDFQFKFYILLDLVMKACVSYYDDDCRAAAFPFCYSTWKASMDGQSVLQTRQSAFSAFCLKYLERWADFWIRRNISTGRSLRKFTQKYPILNILRNNNLITVVQVRIRSHFDGSGFITKSLIRCLGTIQLFNIWHVVTVHNIIR